MNKDPIVHYLENALPDFVKSDYPNFHQLIKDLYANLDEDGNFLDIAARWKSNQSIVTADEEYLSMYMADLNFKPIDKVINKRLFAIFLLEFYASAGSTASFRYLFRSLFDKDVRIEYPRERMLIPSAAEYYTDYFIYTSNDNFNSDAFKWITQNLNQTPARAYGLTSKLEALVESIEIIYTSNKSYLKVGLFPPRYEFAKNEYVEISLGEHSFRENVKNVLKLEVIDPGSLYDINDVVAVTSPSIIGDIRIGRLTTGSIVDIDISDVPPIGSSIVAHVVDSGWGFAARIEERGPVIYSGGYGYTQIPTFWWKDKQLDVTPKLKEVGGIGSIDINRPFIDFNPDVVDVQIISENGSGFKYKIIESTLHIEQGYRSQTGFLGSHSYLHDSHKYQQFSYMIISEVMPADYFSIVDEYLHPAGYLFFPVVDISYFTDLNWNVVARSPTLEEVPAYEFYTEIEMILIVTLCIDISITAEMSTHIIFNAWNTMFNRILLNPQFEVPISVLGEHLTINQLTSDEFRTKRLGHALAPEVEVIDE